ncbi:MAG: hydrogenase small subunit [Candidatus Aminicenantes bacterium]|nr:MAG: hydrogenase small subunit [Candidatus Aminicenantes bacterium]
MNSKIGRISRRDFLKFCGTTAAVLGISKFEFANKVSAAMAASTSGKPAVIWLEGQDCAGCTVSFAGALNPPAASIILDTLSVRYHETIMAAAGHQAEAVYHDTVKEGGYVLVVEGSIPTADGRFCMVGGRPFKEIVLEAGANAAAIIAVGACASFGGIPAAGPTGAVGVSKIVKGKPIINLPSCPVHADHLVGTVLYYLTTKKVPPLDKHGRPLMYFGELIHDNCRRRTYFDEGKVLEDWNSPEQKNWCLIDKGCKGPETYSDCAVRRWNDGLNSCIDCSAGCNGCTETAFYAKTTPLYADEGGRLQERARLAFNNALKDKTKKEV